MGKKNLFFLGIVLLQALACPAQTTYDARNGGSVYPHGVYRILNIYVNIVYDQTPERDPFFGQQTPNWEAGDPDKLNDHPPVYLDRFLDTGRYAQPRGIMTRLFAEASLGHFILLGDFVVVNIRQSEIAPGQKGRDFGNADVIRSALRKIEQLGGVKTIYGHNRIADYDRFEKGNPGQPKKMQPNGKPDIVMFCMRNTTRGTDARGKSFNYGQHKNGEGNAYEGNACSKCSLLMEGQYMNNEITTSQNVGVNDMSQVYKNISFHEFAHCLFGGNGFHTSGGNHFGTGNAAVFMGLQGGYGLMGGANSSLICVNGYERWRMGWLDTISNPEGWAISANGRKGDISRADGPQQFQLRDFISTGDALRIQLPYTDAGAENQYLWLENHQVGRNNKLDFLQYSNEDACRPAGRPGIYAYVQVGKDRLQGGNPGDVYPGDQTDNLRMLTAKGNWDMRLEGLHDTVKCIAWNAAQPSVSYRRENPFCGANDLQSLMFDVSGKAEKIDAKTLCTYPWILRNAGLSGNSLPFMGDDETAFAGRQALDMCSNPAAVNVITCYTSQYNANFTPHKKSNNKNIYLSGLSIEMAPMSDGVMQVDVRWDDYHARRNARWTGPVVLKEQLIVDPGVTLTLDQNETPVQFERDSISGYFSPITTLRCESGSSLMLKAKSKLVLDRNSQLILREGSTLILEKKSKLILKRGSKLLIDGGKVIRQGKIIEK